MLIRKTLLPLQCLNDKEMFDFVNELKAREEMVKELRHLFRHEEEMKRDGFFKSEAEFQQAIVDAFLDCIRQQFKG